MFPVSDGNGWVVGYLCDCGYFKLREGMPKTYDERFIRNKKLEDSKKKLLNGEEDD